MNNLLRLIIGRRLVALPIMVVGVSFVFLHHVAVSHRPGSTSGTGRLRPRSSRRVPCPARSFNDPFFVQYGHYLWNMPTFGTTALARPTTTDLVAQALPITQSFAVIIAFPPRCSRRSVPRPLARPGHPRVLGHRHRHPSFMVRWSAFVRGFRSPARCPRSAKIRAAGSADTSPATLWFPSSVR